MNGQNYKLKLCVNGIEIEVAGDKEFVEKKFNELKEAYFNKNNQNIVGARVEYSEKDKSIGNKKNMSIIEFVNSKKPKSTATELMPVLVYYAKHYKNMNQFNKVDVKSLYRESDNIRKQPQNIYQAILDISRNYGYFEKVPKAKGYFRLTETPGEHLVETKLPKDK